MDSFATIINKAVKYFCKALHHRCSLGPGYASSFPMLHFYHVALLSCCTFLILKNIENERKTENTIKKRPFTKHREVDHFYFGIL